MFDCCVYGLKCGEDEEQNDPDQVVNRRSAADEIAVQRAGHTVELETVPLTKRNGNGPVNADQTAIGAEIVLFPAASSLADFLSAGK